MLALQGENGVQQMAKKEGLDHAMSLFNQQQSMLYSSKIDESLPGTL